jgi:hypothetical protein
VKKYCHLEPSFTKVLDYCTGNPEDIKNKFKYLGTIWLEELKTNHVAPEENKN